MTTALHRVWHLVRHGRFVRRVGVLAGATAAAQGISIAVSPLLTRIYSPGDFGLLAVFASLLGMGSAFASLRYESAIPVPGDDDEARTVVLLAVVTAVATGGLAMVIIVAFGASIADAVNTPSVAPFLWLLPLGISVVGSYHALSRWAVRTQDFTLLARTKVIQSLGAVATQVGVGLSPVGGPLGLIVGSIVGQSAGMTSLASSMRTSDAPRRGLQLTWGDLARAASRYRRFPLLSAPSAALNAIVLYAPALIIAAYHGPVIAGYFALTQRVLGVPMATLGKAVSDVFLGDAAEAGRAGDLVRMRRLFVRAFWALLVVAATLIGGLAIVAPALFSFAFGEAWREAGAMIRLLAPMHVLGFAAAPLGGVLSLLERQDLFLFREVVRLILVVGGLFAVSATGATYEISILVLGLAGALGYAIYAIVSWHALAARLRQTRAAGRDR